MNGRALAICALLTFPVSVSAEEPTRITLQAALEIAHRQNTDLAVADLELQRFHSLYRETLGSAFPSLSFAGTYTRNFLRPVIFFGGEEIRVGEDNAFSAGLSAEQILYAGGKVNKGIHVAHELLIAQQESNRSAAGNVDLAVKSLFYGVLLAREVTAIQDENLASSEKHFRTIKDRFDQGIDSDLAVRRQDVEVADARTLLISARNLYETALLNLKNLLSMDIDQPLEIEDDFGPLKEPFPDYEALSRTALEQRPELLSARRQRGAARTMVSISRGDYLPTLAAFGTYQWSAQSDKLSLVDAQSAESLGGGLALKFDIFQGGKTYQRVRQAKINAHKARLTEEQVQRTVRKEVREKWLALKEAEERVRAQESAVGQARRVLDATEIRYREGESSQLELNDTTFALNRARLAYAQAMHDYWVGQAQLERAVGTKLEDIR